MELNKKNVRTILLIITFAVVIFNLVQHLNTVFGSVKYVWNLFGTVIAGLATAFVLNVPLRVFENRVFRSMKQGNSPFLRKLCRPLSLLCSILVVFGVLALLLVVVLPQISSTVVDLSSKLPQYATEAVNWITKMLNELEMSSDIFSHITIDWESTISKFTDFLKNWATNLIGTVTVVGSTVISGVMNLVFCVIIALYVLAKKESIGAFMRRCVSNFLPERVSRQTLRIAAITNETFSNFVSGQLTEACILGALCYLGMRIFRFPYPEVIAVLVGFTALIPIVGAFIGAAVGAFLILFISPLKAFLFLVFIVVLQQLEGSLIYPRVVGRSVGLPGVIVLCAVLVGGNISGIVGALVSVPVCAVLYTLLHEALDASEARRASKAAVNFEDELK